MSDTLLRSTNHDSRHPLQTIGLNEYIRFPRGISVGLTMFTIATKTCVSFIIKQEITFTRVKENIFPFPPSFPSLSVPRLVPSSFTIPLLLNPSSLLFPFPKAPHLFSQSNPLLDMLPLCSASLTSRLVPLLRGQPRCAQDNGMKCWCDKPPRMLKENTGVCQPGW